MFYHLKNSLQRAAFDWRVRALSGTPPIKLNPQGLSVLSQLQHKDVLMYLAAIKSFACRVPVAQVYVLNDGSLNSSDKATLTEHVPGVEILELLAFQAEGLPKGGTWERLIAIARLSETRYMVQLDADTLTLSEAPEVIQAWRNNQSFTIGTWDRQTLEDARDRATEARPLLSKGNSHVQVLSEAHLDELGGVELLHYVRGCSGFAGFAPSQDKLQFMQLISQQMEKLIHAKWHEWGSEQVMSNLVVANQPNANVLPHPTYADCQKMRPPETRFVHFIGPCRFRGGQYANLIRQSLLS